MKTFNKYEMNVIKATAVENVGTHIEWKLSDAREELERALEDRAMYLQNDDVEEDNWWIQGKDREIAEINARIALWEKLERALEKELA